MTQATLVGTLTFSDYLQRGIREGAMGALLCVALYLVLALVSYSPQDPAWSHIGHGNIVTNAGGKVGAWFSNIAFYLFGILSYLIQIMVAWSGYLIFLRPELGPEIRLHKLALSWFGFLFALVTGCAFANIYLPSLGVRLPNGTGGGLGLLLGDRMILAFGFKWTTLFLFGLFFVGFRLFTGSPGCGGAGCRGGSVLAIMRWVKDEAWFPLRRHRSPVDDVDRSAPLAGGHGVSRVLSNRDGAGDTTGRRARPPPEQSKSVTAAAPVAAQDGSKPESSRFLGAGELPSLKLLDPPCKSGKGYTEEGLEALSRQVEAKLADFGVVAEVVAVHTGPVVVLLELQLAPGTKVSKITGLAKDVARALSTVSVRVVEIMPGKSVIGLELPNEHRETVFLSEVLASPTYQDAKAPLTPWPWGPISPDSRYARTWPACPTP